MVSIRFLLLVCLMFGSRVGHTEPARNPTVATFDILGQIDEDTALGALTAVSALPKRLDVTIDSPGGDTKSTDIIVRAFTSLRTTGAVIRCKVTGRAMSAAFWILQSCSIRQAAPSSKLMIHEPRALFQGETGSLIVATLPFLRSLVSGLERDSENIAVTCAPRMKMTDVDWHKKLAEGDWHMTPQDAILLHALDSLTN